MSRQRRPFRILVLSAFVLGLGAMVAVLLVPSLRNVARSRWHEWRRPDIPAERTELRADGFSDPASLGVPVLSNGPSVHYRHTGIQLNAACSPAISRRIGDVSKDPVAIAIGALVRCAEPDLDLRAIIRIDGADGHPVEWNEKRLRGDEHVPGQWYRFDFEWLLRDVRVSPSDVATVFLTCDEPIGIDEFDMVIRSADPITSVAAHEGR